MNSAPNRRTTLLRMALGMLAISLGSCFRPAYRLIYNPSASAPRGWYLVVPQHSLSVGAFALVRLPPAAEALADERGYLPRSVPLIKHVAATHGQSICTWNDEIRIDGQFVGRALIRDSAGRPLDHWIGCRQLAQEELFLFSADNPASFDSRYFGPIRASALLGEATPVWTW
jgi:conjugative transfer signal peptidase TraF